MTVITDLSSEMLLVILSMFLPYKDTLRQVALVCRRLRDVTRPLIMRSADLGFDSEAQIIQFQRFNRSINEAEELRHMVHSLRICLNYGTPEIHESINGSLGKLAKLQTLAIVDLTSGPAFKFSFWKSNCMPLLKNVNLYGPNWEASEVLPFMFPPSMQVLSAGCLVQLDQVPHFMQRFEAKSSFIKRLDFGSMTMPSATMKGILACTKNLQELKCGLLGNRKLPNGIFDIRGDMAGLLSPVDVMGALSPIMNSLIELHLVGDLAEWPSHDGTKFDFGQFLSLERLNIPSICLFASKSASLDRDGVHKLLPASLKEMIIHFDYGIGIASSTTPSKEEIHRYQQGVFEDWKYCWLIDIAKNKSKLFPGLSSLTLRERLRKFRKVGDKCKPIPQYVEDTFTTVGISLDTTFRATKYMP